MAFCDVNKQENPKPPQSDWGALKTKDVFIKKRKYFAKVIIKSKNLKTQTKQNLKKMVFQSGCDEDLYRPARLLFQLKRGLFSIELFEQQFLQLLNYKTG